MHSWGFLSHGLRILQFNQHKRQMSSGKWQWVMDYSKFNQMATAVTISDVGLKCIKTGVQ